MWKFGIIVTVLLSHFMMPTRGAAASTEFAPSTVATTSGMLHGVTTVVDGRPLSRFLGVPYGQAPVGSLRFRPPLPLAMDETSPIDASHFRATCMQPPHLRRVIYRPLHQNLDDELVSEDCLHLNLYVPGKVTDDFRKSSNKSLLAVMVWLPGEGFDFGNANQYDGSRLAVSGNVMVVTVNYRLSVFGFLSTGDGQAPGNLGLMDQILALRWIKNNVEKFGGDPNKVTLFGRLTGSVSITALMASAEQRQPHGERLFHKAILQSGVAQGNWIFENNPLEQAISFARHVNCSHGNESTTQLIECLRAVPAKSLLKAAFTVDRPWRLIVGNDFLPDTPLASTSLAPIDVVVGGNSHEGSICLLTHLVQKTEFMDRFLDDTLSPADLQNLVETHVEDYFGAKGKENQQLATAIREQYPCEEGSSNFSSASVGNCRHQFLTFCGDLYTHSAIANLADKLVKDNELRASQRHQVYRYEFHHRPTFSHFPDFVGAAQGDEVLFIFGLMDHPSLDNVSKEEVKLSRQMMAAWTNFAKTGNPNPFHKNVVWPSYNTKKFLEITTHMGPTSIKNTSFSDHFEFWTNIISSVTSRSS